MTKHIIFKIITVWFLLTQTFPSFNLLFPIGGAFKLAFFCGLTLVLFPDLFSKRSIIALIVYGLVCFTFYLLGNAYFETINHVVVPLLVMLSGLLLAEYTLKYDTDFKYTRLVVFVVFAANLVMVLVSIPQVLVNPNIIRPTNDEYAEVNYFLITYQTCHGIPILFAPLVFLCRNTYRNNKKIFLIWFIITLFLFVIIFLSNATTSLLVSIIMVAVGLLFKTKQFTRQSVAAMVGVGLISLFLIQPGVIVPIIEAFQRNMDPLASNYKKMDEIKDNIIYGEADGDLGSRQRLYDTSTDLFFESPLLGTSTPERISHHTWIIDHLACFGIIMISPLVLVFFFNIKSIYRCLKHTRVTYVFGVSGLLLMLYLKNDFGQGTWLYGFAYLPLLCRYIDYIIDNN